MAALSGEFALGARGPARPGSRQEDIYKRHCTGAGSTFSLYLKGGEREAFAFLDALKIDKSFILGMDESENDEVIVRSTIDLGRNLGLRVVAEGVESPQAWSRLAQLGCNVAQGYFLSRPMPAEQLTEWLADRAGRRRSA